MKKPSVKQPLQIYAPPGACTWKISLKYKVKQSKNDKLSPIDFETQLNFLQRPLKNEILWYTCQMKPFHLLFYSDKLFPAFGFGARIPPSYQVCGLISLVLPLGILDHYVSGKLPTYPSPKPILTLTSQLEQNVGLGEG